MKRFFACFIFIVAAAVFAAGLSGCEKVGIPETPGSGQGGEETTDPVRISFYSDGTLYGIALCTDGAFAMPEDPEKPGYSFVGWFYERELVTPFVYEEFIAREDKTDISLYAAWNYIGETPSPGGGDEDGGDEETPGGGDGGEEETPQEPETATYTVTFVMGGQVVATQKVEEGKDAALPVSRFAVDGNALYTVVAEGNYTAVVKDETVTLSLREATEEEYGLFALSFMTLLVKDGKLYVSDISAAYPLDRIALPSQWGYFAIDGIKAGAFARVPHIKSVKTGKYCTDIEWSAFDDLTALESVEFDEENAAYSSLGLFVTDAAGKEVITYLGGDGGKLVLPEGVTAIADAAFEGWNLTSAVAPEGLVSIGERAFAGCAFLESVTLPDSVESIGAEAFENCASLAVLPVPESTTCLGDRAVACCVNAELVDYRAENLSALVKDNGIFDGAGKNNGLTLCVAGSALTVPARLFDCSGAGSVYLVGIKFAEACAPTHIGAEAFRESAIKSVTIPSSVTDIGSNAFAGCESLALVEYRAENAVTQGMSGAVFAGAGADGSVFKVGKEVSSVPDYLLYSLTDKANFSSLIFEKGGLERIGTLSFAGSAITGEVIIPASVTEIGDGAFAETAVTAFCVAEGGSAYVAQGGVLYSADGSRLAAYPTGKKDGSFTANGGITEIAAYAFAGAEYLEKIEIFCARVGEYAFYNCGKLAAATLSEGVSEIGTGAFANCGTLYAVACPSSLRIIGENAFMYCSSLSEVTLNEGLTAIGSRAFAYCDALGEVDIPSTVEKTGDDIFIK